MSSIFTQSLKGPTQEGPLKEVGGRYLLLERIDRGRCAEVHLALDRKDGAKVAAKLALPGEGGDFVRAVFRNEARALELGAHRNVVRLIDTDTRTAEPFLIMEYVPGPTLRTLSYEGRIDRKGALRLVGGMLEALERMHGLGLVHRDLKPKNIMLGPEREAKLIDFGFAYVPGIPDITAASDKRFGNPVYSPPERMNGAGDPRADIYSVGMMMHELLSRGVPCRMLETARLLFVHRLPSFVAAEASIGILDPEAAEVIGTALCRDPAGRFQSAREMRERVELLLASPA